MIGNSDELKKIIELNGINLLTTEKNKYRYETYKGSYMDHYVNTEKTTDINFIKPLYNASTKVLINSDVFDLFDEKIGLNGFEYKDILECYYHFIVNSIDFIASISNENDEGVLIQNTFNKEKGLFLSTIGLLNDSRIIFLEIREIR